MNEPEPTEHEKICYALSMLGQVMRRANGVGEEPKVDVNFRRERLLVVSGLPEGYLVLVRQNNTTDIGFVICRGPGGWEHRTYTAKLGEEACWRHHAATRKDSLNTSQLNPPIWSTPFEGDDASDKEPKT